MLVNRSILTCICGGVALATLSTAQARDVRHLNIFVRTPDGSPSEGAVVLFLSASGEMVPATAVPGGFSAENVGSKLVIEVSHPNLGVATVYGALEREWRDNWVGVSFVSPNRARLLQPGGGVNSTATTPGGGAVLGNCPGAGGDCCTADGTPGCDDVDCCDAVCGIDPFCCDTAWDSICANEACSNFPAVCDCCPEPGGNDACVDRLDIFEGSTPYTNIGATTDGPSPCGGLGSDIWYNYTATCTGVVTVTTCPPNGGANYDSAIAAYDGCGCPVGAPLACNDDFCGLQTQITFPVVAGNCYKLQVGGFNGSQGSGTISLTCGVPCDDLACPGGSLLEPEPCGSDTNGGCNSAPPAFTNAACGDTWCGTAWAAGGTRDTDWYLVCHGGGTLSATLVSEAQNLCFIVDGISTCAPVVVGQIGCSNTCDPIQDASADLPAGQYVVFVAAGGCDGSGIFDGNPCGTTNDYYVTISCAGGGCDSNADCLPGEVCVNGCCVPTGACCFSDGACVDAITAGECTAQGGNYQGDNTMCAAGPGSNCCVPNGGLGCDDPECEAIVCGVDPFCCDTAWDSICADEAQQLCGDLCASVFCPQICGPGNPNGCCSPNGTPGCDDSDCCDAVCAIDPFCCDVAWDSICASEALQFPLECNRSDCIPCTCGDPGAGDCCVPHAGPCCNDLECCDIVCGIDPFCCQVGGTWDLTCAGEAANLCGDLCPPPPCPGAPFACGQPGTGPCEVPGGVPGCSDCDCCALVCGIDPFCCDISWDGICANEAVAFCGEPCTTFKCPPGSDIEPEPCGDDTNGGCNSSPPVFTDAACGDTWCGTAWAAGGTRDTDWYRVCHGGGIISAHLVSEIPCVAFIVDGLSTCTPVVVGAIGCGDDCASIADASADLPPGQYVVFVAPGTCDGGGLFDGFPCGGPQGNDYSVAISCTPPPSGCNSNADCPPGDICVNGCCVKGPPANDLCVDATPLPLPPGGSTSVAGTNGNGATNDGAPACPGGLPQVGPGVWYSFIGNGNTVTVSTCPGGGGGSNCCIPNGGLGCDDPECQALVCGIDPFCCDVAWDGICAAEAADLCGDLCAGGGGADFDTMLTVFCGDCPQPPASNCCIANGGVGCDDPECQAIVCGVDPFCCDVAWDSICADEAAQLCGDLCTPAGGSLCIVGNDDFCGLQSQVSFCAKAGSQYLILVHGFAGATGDFTLVVSDDDVPCVPTVDCPLASCFQIISQSTECIGAGGDFNFHVVGTAECIGGTPMTFDFVGSGGDPGEQMCFEISLFDNNGDLCCNATVCTTVPDCTPSSQPCDLDGDQVIGVTDMLILLAAWNSNPGGPPDYDGDGTVAISDFLYLLSNWGPCQ